MFYLLVHVYSPALVLGCNYDQMKTNLSFTCSKGQHCHGDMLSTKTCLPILSKKQFGYFGGVDKVR